MSIILWAQRKSLSARRRSDLNGSESLAYVQLCRITKICPYFQLEEEGAVFPKGR